MLRIVSYVIEIRTPCMCVQPYVYCYGVFVSHIYIIYIMLRISELQKNELLKQVMK